MNPIHQCFQKISSGNHFSYVRDRMYVRTDKGDAICPPPPPPPPPPPIINSGGITTRWIDGSLHAFIAHAKAGVTEKKLLENLFTLLHRHKCHSLLKSISKIKPCINKAIHIGIARTLKKLHTSKGDYCIKQ